jgi:hypothetical protein
MHGPVEIWVFPPGEPGPRTTKIDGQGKQSVGSAARESHFEFSIPPSNMGLDRTIYETAHANRRLEAWSICA